MPESPELASLDRTLTVLNGVLSTPYFRSRFLLEQSVVGPSARQRLLFGNYTGGHMFYLNAASRAELFKDVAAFFK